METNKIVFFEIVEKYRRHVYIFGFLGFLFFMMTGMTNFPDVNGGFRGRTRLIQGYSMLCVKLGNRVFDNSLIGKNGWLFYTGEDSVPDYQNTFPFTNEELKTIQLKLDKLSTRLADQGIHLLVVVPPNKNTIYSDYLPQEIPIIGPKSRLDQIIDYQKENGQEKVLDFRSVLLAARNKMPVYYRTDTHWNDYGAFLAYQEIMTVMQSWFPDIKAHTLADFELVPGINTGDIAVNMIKYPEISEEALRLVPLFERAYSIKAWDQQNEPKTGPNQVTTIPDSTLPKLMMYHDSFTTNLMPFLSDHFRQVDYYRGFSIDMANIANEKPDVVVIELTERYLGQLLALPGDD